MPNNINQFLVTVKLPCPKCEGRGEIQNPIARLWADECSHAAGGFNDFALRMGIQNPSELPARITCPQCKGAKWAQVDDLPIGTLVALLNDNYKALERELDTQVSALAKSLADHQNTLDHQDREAGRARTDITRLAGELKDIVTILDTHGDRLDKFEANLRELVADHQTPGHPNLVAADEGGRESLHDLWKLAQNHERRLQEFQAERNPTSENRKLLDAEHHDLVRRVRDIEDGKIVNLEGTRASLFDLCHSFQVLEEKVEKLQLLSNDDHTDLLDVLAWRHSLTRKRTSRKRAPRRKAKR